MTSMHYCLQQHVVPMLAWGCEECMRVTLRPLYHLTACLIPCWRPTRRVAPRLRVSAA